MRQQLLLSQRFEEGLGSEQADEGRRAMDDEMKSLHAIQTWTPEPISTAIWPLPVK